MKAAPERVMAIAFSTSLLLVAVMALAAYYNIRNMLRTTDRIQRSHQVLADLEKVHGLIAEAEAAQRGFVISGDKEFLIPYNKNVPEIDRSLKSLRELTADNQSQKKSLEQLESAIRNKLQITETNLHIRETQGSQSAIEAISSGTGLAAMNEVQQQIHNMQKAELQALNQLRARELTGTHRTIRIIVLVTILTLAVAAAARKLVLQNVEQRRRAEEDRDRFFTLELDMLCICGFDGKFIRLNPAWEKTLGFTLQELTSRPFMEFVHPEDREATAAELGKQLQGNVVVNFENRYLCKDGSYKWLHWNSTPFAESQLIFATARDITERKRAEQEIDRLNRELKARLADLSAANQELEAFSYSVSHDLRAPLRHIIGFVDLLAKNSGGVLDPTGQHYLKTISDASMKMGTLIDDLLLFSRTGRSELRKTNTNMAAIVEDVIRGLDQQDGDRNIQWSVDSLPDIEADVSLLRQVWVNLLSNAVKYTASRDPAVIHIGATNNPDEVVFYVRDNGVGFDMQYADKLYGVFQRLHSPKDFPGTGIGLANVRRIISRHGGRTWAEGSPGNGAIFYFSLPRQ